MAANFYLKLEANGTQLQGEAQDARYGGWIEVVAYKFSGKRAAAGDAGARRMGRVSMGNLILRKRADAASPLIMRAFVNNEDCKVKLVLCKAGGEQEDYLTIELTNAVIAAVEQGNLDFGGESPEEELELSYSKISMEYNAQADQTGIVRGGIYWEYEVFSGSGA